MLFLDKAVCFNRPTIKTISYVLRLIITMLQRDSYAIYVATVTKYHATHLDSLIHS